MTHGQGPSGVDARLYLRDEPAPALLEAGEFGVDADTLLIADWFNAAMASEFEPLCRVHIARDAVRSEIDQIVAGGGFGRVVAVGGCSALDFARACARHTMRPFTVFPSILSTACISVDYSVIYPGALHGWPTFEPTRAPDHVVVSYPLIESAGRHEIAKWSLSGVGDLFARIGGLLEEDGARPPGPGDLREVSPCTFDALDWFEAEFREWNRSTLARLAQLLHAASVEATTSMRTGRSIVGGEHDLYYALRTIPGYSRDRQTHGRLVSIGTLIAVHAVADAQPSWQPIKEKIRVVYERVGLPTTGRDLEAIGVSRENLLAGLRLMKRRSSFLARVYCASGDDLVDSVYYA